MEFPGTQFPTRKIRISLGLYSLGVELFFDDLGKKQTNLSSKNTPLDMSVIPDETKVRRLLILKSI